jgi:DNA-binding MarR family transcriptional regulator
MNDNVGTSPTSATPLQLLHRAGQCAGAEFEAAMRAAKLDLTPRQMAVMAALRAADGASQTQLTSLTGVDRSTLSDIMRRLVKKRLAQRRRTGRDKRAYTISLTDAGTELLSQAQPAVDAVNQQLLQAIPQDLRNCFISALRCLIAQIDGATTPDRSRDGA